MKFTFYVLNTSVPELDGASHDPYGHWLGGGYPVASRPHPARRTACDA
jgi:hypothetical protein